MLAFLGGFVVAVLVCAVYVVFDPDAGYNLRRKIGID